MSDFLESVGLGTIVALLFIGLLFLYAVGGALIGLFVGWILSLTPLGAFVEDGLCVFWIGAKGQLLPVSTALGFLAGIFHGTITVKKEEK